MIPSNFIHAGPLRRIKQINYTDGSPSREVEDEELKPTIEHLRKRLIYVIRLIEDIQQELKNL